MGETRDILQAPQRVIPSIGVGLAVSLVVHAGGAAWLRLAWADGLGSATADRVRAGEGVWLDFSAPALESDSIPAGVEPAPALPEPASADTPDPTPPPPPPPPMSEPPQEPETKPTIGLGIERGIETAKGWIGFEDPTPHSAPRATIDQADVTDATPGGPTAARAGGSAPMTDASTNDREPRPAEPPPVAPAPPLAAPASSPASPPVLPAEPPEPAATPGGRALAPPVVSPEIPSETLFPTDPNAWDTAEPEPVKSFEGTPATPARIDGPDDSDEGKAEDRDDAAEAAEAVREALMRSLWPMASVAPIDASPQTDSVEPAPTMTPSVAVPEPAPVAEPRTDAPPARDPADGEGDEDRDAGAGGKPGIMDDKQATAASATPTPTAVYQPGRPAALKGVELKTVLWKVNEVTRLTLTPKNPVVELTFRPDGKVARVAFARHERTGRLLNTGHTDWDEPIKDALYRWEVAARSMVSFRREYPGGVTVRLTIVLR